MSEKTYKVMISGAGLNLEREVPASVGEQVVVLVLTGAVGSPGKHIPPGRGGDLQGNGLHPAAGSVPGDVSIREYLDDRAAKRSPDKIAAIGCYLKEHRSQLSFNRADLEGLFEDAAEPVPKNMPRDIKWATRVGWISPKNDDKGTYYVTAKGITAVKDKFPKDVKKKTSQNVGKSKRPTGKKNVEE